MGTLGLLLAATFHAALPAAAQEGPAPAGPHDATSRRSFENVEHWVRVFDDPARDEWQKPAEVVSRLGLRPGMIVADVGAGTGYMSAHLSRAVGEGGSVLGADVEPRLVRHLRERAEEEGTENVIPILASADNPRLPRRSVDLILFVNTVHHIDDRIEYLRRLKRTLADGGRVAILDWKQGDLPVGPPPDHRLQARRVRDEMEAAGYRQVEQHDFLPYQYFLVFAPEDA